MGDQFLSEIRAFSFNFPPKGWAFCNGQMLPINQNQALFSLLGTTYGGNGQTTFQLPNLQGRVPIHTGNGFTLGQIGGETAHTLLLAELPQHLHVASGTTDTTNAGYVAAGAVPTTGEHLYGTSPTTTLADGTLTFTGGSQPHTNMQPYSVITYCIALQGIFPSRN